MTPRTLTLGLRKQGLGEEIEVGRRTWEAPHLPDWDTFLAEVEALYAHVQLPKFPARAWVEIVMPSGAMTQDEVVYAQVGDAVDDPRAVAERLWGWVATAQGASAEVAEAPFPVEDPPDWIGGPA